MDYNERKWKLKSVYLTEESKKILRDLSYKMNESKSFILNMLIQEKGNELLSKTENT